MQKVIALDAMGGDQGPDIVVPAAANVLMRHEDVHLTLVGQEKVLKPLIRQHIKGDISSRLTIHHASEIVEMDESPSNAMRNKKDSSMRVALDLVKEGSALACVSAGNTGALMATARFVLKTLPGIDRPAIATHIPTHLGKATRALDLGANVDSTPEHLYQFAVMGSILSSAVDRVASPRVALLNIGEEEIKGNELVKSAAEIFSQSDALNYIGYIEADKLFDDQADVIVCDGFVGNIMLKSIEGVIHFLADLVKEEFLKNLLTKALVAPSKPIIKRVIKRVDPESHNGAALLGLDGIVVKSHGGTTVKGFAFAIEEAILETEKNIPQLIREQVSSILKSEE